MSDKLVCQVCEREFDQITAIHLKKHGLTVAEYKTMFPGCETMKNETRNFLSKKCKSQNQTDKFGFKNQHKTNLGKIPWNKGLNKFNDERVKRQSESSKGKIFTGEHRYKISKRMKEAFKNGKIDIFGKNNGMFGRKLSSEHLKKLLESRQKYDSINKVELKAFNTLIQYGFKYTGNGKFWLRFKDGTNKNPDFINSKAKFAVEVYGDYWHKNDVPEELINKYREIGWECIVIWEREVNTSFSPDVFEQLLNIFELEEFTYDDFEGSWIG